MNLNFALFAQCLVFIIFALFTMKFVWPPLIKVIDERRKQIADGLAAAEQGNRAQAEAHVNAKEILTDAKQKAAEIVANAQKKSAEAIEQSKLDSKIEGEKQLKLAMDQIILEQNKAKEQLRSQIVSISVSGAQKIMKKEINEQVHSKLLDDLIAQL